ncbi:MAG: hypothetical protein MZU91_06655 [Desulfosudis oleivorans]|nr:hypothetical protein [Desulfosudis oleivorans]
MMGSGGMIVMDEHDLHGGRGPLLPELPAGRVLRQVRSLPRRASGGCGDILADITEGRGREGTLALLESMSKAIIDGALCALGQQRPEPRAQHHPLLQG